MYPFVQKIYDYPVGYANVFVNKVCSESGLIKCKILPLRINGKLIFCLCRTCSEFNLTECDHSDDKNCLQETWMSVKVQKALENGYEIYDFCKKDRIFKYYVNTFLKIRG